MTLFSFKKLIEGRPATAFRIVLPDGARVPVSFHVTEVGRVQKTFVDCGGVLRENVSCRLQVWIGEDEEHRLETTKIAAILKRAESFLPDENIPLEIEYEDRVISQYAVEEAVSDDTGVVLHLAHMHTACLAPDKCGVTRAQPVSFQVAPSKSCCGPSGCH